MVDITARTICDSINPSGNRVITMLTRYPKFVHGEHLRHRSFSFSVSSSRAIPVAKNLEEVRSDALRAGPIWWGREQKGMQSGEELSDEPIAEVDWHGPLPDERPLLSKRQLAKEQWRSAALTAAGIAQNLHLRGVHKSIVNRILEPFLHVNVLVSGTTSGWMNFFGLRLDRAAQLEIRALAEACWKVWNESRPRQLRPEEWHLPFVDQQYVDEVNRIAIAQDEWAMNKIAEDLERKVSTACCAHLSYMSFGSEPRRMTVSQCVALHDRLVGSVPIHASPAEHQATPDEQVGYEIQVRISSENHLNGLNLSTWRHSDQSGNFDPGWRQYRKMLPGEAIAPLPEGYVP
ncbi:MAG: FAD-dependent thymidylate synthase [Elusimicrobia bacterium]|nr:FAD-dependent thymidylate synthase [Elusimicrobiota bacterium]